MKLFTHKIKNLRISFLSLLLLCGVFGANAQLSGTFTIDPNGSGSTNFASIGDAVDSLDDVGVNGPVTFNLSSDTFNEAVTISAISGASSTNLITFSGNGMSNTVVRNTAVVFSLDGASSIRLVNMTIENTSTSFNTYVIDIDDSDTIYVDSFRLEDENNFGNYTV